MLSIKIWLALLAMAPGMAKDDDPPFGREQEQAEPDADEPEESPEPEEPTDDDNGRDDESEAEDMPPDDDAPWA